MTSPTIAAVVAEVAEVVHRLECHREDAVEPSFLTWV